MNKNEREKEILGLIEVLTDKDASIAEKDDAVMYLSRYDDDRILKVLASIGSSSEEDQIVLWSCGTGIAEIYLQRNYFDESIYCQLRPEAKLEVFSLIKAKKPEWIEKYHLKR